MAGTEPRLPSTELTEAERFRCTYFIMSALIQPSQEAPVSQVMSEVIARTKIEKILQRKPWKEEEEKKNFRGFRSNRHKFEVSVKLKNREELNRSQLFFSFFFFFRFCFIFYSASCTWLCSCVMSRKSRAAHTGPPLTNAAARLCTRAEQVVYGSGLEEKKNPRSARDRSRDRRHPPRTGSSWTSLSRSQLRQEPLNFTGNQPGWESEKTSSRSEPRTPSVGPWTGSECRSSTLWMTTSWSIESAPALTETCSRWVSHWVIWLWTRHRRIQSWWTNRQTATDSHFLCVVEVDGRWQLQSAAAWLSFCCIRRTKMKLFFYTFLRCVHQCWCRKLLGPRLAELWALHQSGAWCLLHALAPPALPALEKWQWTFKT